jgi:hypothetical protein
MNDILFSGDYIDIEFDYNENEYLIGLYDNHQHFIEKIKFTKNQLNELSYFLNKNNSMFDTEF